MGAKETVSVVLGPIVVGVFWQGFPAPDLKGGAKRSQGVLVAAAGHGLLGDLQLRRKDLGVDQARGICTEGVAARACLEQ